MNVTYQVIPIGKLKHFIVRDIRQSAVEELKERISDSYNPSKPLTVVEVDGEYLVANGNHRLKASIELGVKELPCVIVDGDPYKLAIQGNEDEDTYSPMDLFDWLEVIQKMKEEGYTQQEIGDRIGWSRDKIKNHQRLLSEVGTNILVKAKSLQIGRVPSFGTNVPFDFTEGWFRNSGLYDLEHAYQEKLLDRFIADKFNWNSGKVKSESAKYKQWQEFKKTASEMLVNPKDLDEIVSLIESGSFRSEDQLLNKIKDYNAKAESKLICGDSIIEIEKLNDNSIDLIITDPPYGVDYASNRSKYNDAVTKTKIANDSDLEQALELTEAVLEVLDRKTKDDAHLYLFTSWAVYPQFKEVVEKYFTVKNLIVWDKGNHSMGDLEGSWGNKYELIIFATKGNKKLVKRKADIIQVNRIPSVNAIHPTQKPETLITELLEASARTKDTVIDPFMGSGSTIKAIKQFGDLNYIGIELDKDRFNKAIAYIGVD